MRKVRFEAWSHCAECWMFYGSFNTAEDGWRHIAAQGMARRYFRIGL